MSKQVVDTKKLRTHQVIAVNRLRNGNILCGNVGSGKSKTAIVCYLKSIGAVTVKNDGSVNWTGKKTLANKRDLYIITTARKRDTLEWHDECIQYKLGIDEKNNPYEILLKIDSWNNIKKYVEVSGAFFIFDEQRVVGSGAWVKSFLKITKRNRWILLTATPGDTWLDYIPVFIANGFYKNRTQFIKQHVLFNRYSKYPKVDKYLNQDLLESHRDAIVVDMYYTRSVKKHALTIPVQFEKEKTETIVKRRWNEYSNEPIKNAAEYCYALRRVLNSDGSRIQAVIDLIMQHSKVIIFYNFDYELELLRDGLVDNGIPWSEWNGHKHESILDTDMWAYLVQYTAGSEGWNCVETNTIIFYSLNYSYKTMVQAAGRIDRMNSPYFDLYYYYLVSANFFDKAIEKVLKTKETFNEALFCKSLF